MNIVFLRGSVPPKNEHPEKLLYKKINQCEDMWTQLFYYVTQKLNAHGTLLYQNGNRKFKVNNSFMEKWVPSIGTHKEPADLIVCRGGFPYYDGFIKRYPKAKKVYYGAGKRFYPQGFIHYNLFLTDSLKQSRIIRRRGSKSSLFIKPAATMFSPVKCEKEYDICFMANATQAKIKRHRLFLKSMAGTGHRILVLGNTNKKWINLAKELKLDVTWGEWSLRKDLPAKISKCKVGVCCSTNYDSCPRVIPEYLACDLPVVATDNINFWHDKYITEDTGILVNEANLKEGIQKALEGTFSPRSYYDKALSMPMAAGYLASLIKKTL
jgi:glycosyltransferase involved in cell wall biosynthesis